MFVRSILREMPRQLDATNKSGFPTNLLLFPNAFWFCAVSLPSLTKFQSQHPNFLRVGDVDREVSGLLMSWLKAWNWCCFTSQHAAWVDVRRVLHMLHQWIFSFVIEEAGCNLEGMIWLGSPATQAGSYFHYYPFQSELIMAGVLNLSGVVCYHQGWCGACIEFDNVIRDVQSALKPFAESADIEFVWISCDARLWPHSFLCFFDFPDQLSCLS